MPTQKQLDHLDGYVSSMISDMPFQQKDLHRTWTLNMQLAH
ncbi:hypothetical protein ACFCVU_10685 [Peribacillus butanolivorans]